MSLFPEPPDDLPERFDDDDDEVLEGLDSEDKPIERNCSDCDEPFNISISLATLLPPDSEFNLCPACMEKLRHQGRDLLQSEGPIYDE